MKVIIRWVAVCCLAGFTSMATAERLEVFRWRANSSSPEGLLQGMMIAAKKHTAMGAKINIYQEGVGGKRQGALRDVRR